MLNDLSQDLKYGHDSLSEDDDVNSLDRHEGIDYARSISDINEPIDYTRKDSLTDDMAKSYPLIGNTHYSGLTVTKKSSLPARNPNYRVDSMI